MHSQKSGRNFISLCAALLTLGFLGRDSQAEGLFSPDQLEACVIKNVDKAVATDKDAKIPPEKLPAPAPVVEVAKDATKAETHEVPEPKVVEEPIFKPNQAELDARLNQLGASYVSMFKELEELRAEMKQKHPYLAARGVVDRVVDIEEANRLFPEKVTGLPIVIAVAEPGYGKTRFYTEFVRRVGGTDRFIRQTLSKDDRDMIQFEPMKRFSVDANLPPKHGTQFYYLVDEAQKVRPASEVLADATQAEKIQSGDFGPVGKGPEDVAKDSDDDDGYYSKMWEKSIEKREASGNKALTRSNLREQNDSYWWQANGNGEYTDKNIPKFQDLVNQTVGVQVNAAAWEAQVDNALTNAENTFDQWRNQNPTAAETIVFENQSTWPPVLRNQEKQWLRAIDTAKKGQANYLIQTVMPLMTQFREYYGPFLGKYAKMTDSELADNFASDANQVIGDLKALVKTVPPQQDRSIRNGMVFVAANSDDLTAARINALDPKTVDFDTVRAAVAQTPFSAVFKQFSDRFGTDMGWQRRWRMQDWQPMLPFSNLEAKEAVATRVTNIITDFQKDLSKMGAAPVKVEVDPSINDMLYKNAMKPLEVGLFYERSANMFDGPMARVLNNLLATPDAERPKKIRVAFDPKTQELVVNSVESEITDATKTAEHPTKPWSRRLPIAMEKATPANLLADGSFDFVGATEAAHQAGTTLGGLIMFNSAPINVIGRPSVGLNDVLDMWPPPNVKNLDYARKVIVANMVGTLAEKTLLKMSHLSAYAQSDAGITKQALQEIRDELNLQRNQFDYLAGPGQKLPDVGKVVDISGNRAVLVPIGNNDDKAAMAMLNSIAMQIINKNQPLLAALASAIKEKKNLTGADIQKIVADVLPDRGKNPKGPSLASAIQKSYLGATNLDAPWALLPAEPIAKHPGFWAKMWNFVMRRKPPKEEPPTGPPPVKTLQTGKQ
jgi:hypothetical protein